MIVAVILLLVCLFIAGVYFVITTDDEYITDEEIKRFDKWLEEDRRVRKENSTTAPAYIFEKKVTPKTKKPVTSKTKVSKAKATKKVSRTTKKTRR